MINLSLENQSHDLRLVVPTLYGLLLGNSHAPLHAPLASGPGLSLENILDNTTMTLKELTYTSPIIQQYVFSSHALSRCLVFKTRREKKEL